jgi:hypothetical protein
MGLSRRRFLRVVLGTGLLAWSGVIFKKALWPAPLSDTERAVFSAYLQTLIPADETPGAVELGVDRKLSVQVDADRAYLRLVRKGCAWLNEQARATGGESFPGLDGTERDVVVALAAQAPSDSLVRIFFDRTRLDAFSEYYADPQSWAGLPYARSPQPLGFTDYQLPPRG